MVSSWVTDLKQQKNPSSSLSPSDSKTAAVILSPQSAAKKWSLQCEKRAGLGFLLCFGVSRLTWNIGTYVPSSLGMVPG